MHRGRPSPFDASVHTTSRDRTNALGWFDPAYGTVGIEGLVVETASSFCRPGRPRWQLVEGPCLRH